MLLKIIICLLAGVLILKLSRKVFQRKKRKRNTKKMGGWYWYFSRGAKKLVPSKCGKWMVFFSDQAFARRICKKAIEEQVCYECKCTNMKQAQRESGVICFYLNGDDIDTHKRIIQFMMQNDLIRRTKAGRFYNMSFKFDSQTKAKQYGNDFEGVIKLDQFIDLHTGEWII